MNFNDKLCYIISERQYTHVNTMSNSSYFQKALSHEITKRALFQGSTSDVVLCVACFVSVSVQISPSMCLDDFSQVEVAEWAPFRKALLIRLTVCSLCISYFGCFPFWFRSLDCDSDCTSSWSLLTFFIFNLICLKISQCF